MDMSAGTQRVRRRKADSRPEPGRHQGPGGAGSTSTSRAQSPQATTPQANAPREPIETSLQGTGDGTTDNPGRPHLPSQTFFVDRRCHELARPHTPSIHAPDMFRGSAFLSRFAILGDDFPGIDMEHKDEAMPLHSISPLELQTLQLHGAFELPNMALRQSLVDAFFEWCWAWSPVLDHAGMGVETKSSLVILQAVLLAGSVMRPKVCPVEMAGALYRRVKALIHARYEEYPLTYLAAIVLLQWHTPTPPKDVTTDLPRFWMTYALALAQQMGLHREPSQNDRDRNLRRRIWWSIYVCDCFSAAAEGRPRLINLEDCSVSPPTIHDFPRESEVTALVFVSFVAAGLCLEIFEAIHLRELTPYLATIFSWNILVAAVSQISWSRVTGLREQCNAALDSIENILSTFVSTRPAAANNLRNIRAIRRAVMNREVLVPTQMPTPVSQDDADEASGATTATDTSGLSIPDVLQWYGPKMESHFQCIIQIFRRHCALLGGRVAGRLLEQNHAVGHENSQNQVVGNGDASQPTDGSLHLEMDDINALVDGANDPLPEDLRNDMWMRDLVEELEMVYDVVM
ncbi:hypothetical protein NW754_001472 [Fusarium falciforme]|nr:hypothetical protein NW754_001472 [Fusarium falciforme]